MNHLTEISTADLELVAESLGNGRIQRLDPAGLGALGLGRLATQVDPLVGLDRAAALMVVRAVIAERQTDSPRLELVWTGPETGLRPARDTAAALRDLFGQARREVLVCGYSFTQGARSLAALHDAIRDRGVRATLFLNIPRAPRGSSAQGIENHVGTEMKRFLRDNWPTDVAPPDLYYDPRTVAPDSKCSLHAKCAAVDGQRALVSSANFTYSGQVTNLEVGVLIDDPTFVGRLVEQCLSLIPAGLMRRHELSSSG